MKLFQTSKVLVRVLQFCVGSTSHSGAQLKGTKTLTEGLLPSGDGPGEGSGPQCGTLGSCLHAGFASHQLVPELTPSGQDPFPL